MGRENVDFHAQAEAVNTVLTRCGRSIQPHEARRLREVLKTIVRLKALKELIQQDDDQASDEAARQLVTLLDLPKR